MQPFPPAPGPPRRPHNSSPATATTRSAAVVGEGSSRSDDRAESQSQGQTPGGTAQAKRRKHRGGKKKRNRRQSFAAPSDDGSAIASMLGDHTADDSPSRPPANLQPQQFYRLTRGNMSNSSLDSDTLLDHRDQPSMRPRRESRLGQAMNSPYRSSPPKQSSSRHDFKGLSGFRPAFRQSTFRQHQEYTGNSDSDGEGHDRTPLLATPTESRNRELFSTSFRNPQNHHRPHSRDSTVSSRRRRRDLARGQSYNTGVDSQEDYDVNNPPSVPSSPHLGADLGYDDVMVGGFPSARSPDTRRDRDRDVPNDVVIDMEDRRGLETVAESTPVSPRLEPAELTRRRTIVLPAEEDVCFPGEGLSELAEEDYPRLEQTTSARARKRRRRRWPDLSILEEWSREEKEERSEGLRQMRISEPTLVNGRLRPSKLVWHRPEEVAPYRFTYFNEEFQSTIHAQTISELVQPGGNFQELFIPDPPVLSDSSSEDEAEEEPSQVGSTEKPSSPTTTHMPAAMGSLLGELKADSKHTSGSATPQRISPQPKPKRYGPRPTFWLDVLSPTDAEMRVISKAFGIHALTAEDIMTQEAREKVELFRNYYFINYRSFEQDMNSDTFLEPINMYVVVFREGVLSFHFSQTPHPANVRRRIRQLKDYLILSSDWISYAIIDDITDVFQPLIQNIEEEVDDIDDFVLRIFEDPTASSPPPPSIYKDKPLGKDREKQSEVGGDKEPSSGMDMLRRVGSCRKKVMGLYRLLGNKADVIKGFAKRCNEQWEVAPKSEIGLYLGDIQDHILTMTSNLSHYEALLSRAHSNYLAHVNIRMNDRAEKSADVLGKLTVMGTIVLPLNVVCGLFGANVKIPGQEVDNLNWFWGLTGGMVIFSVVCFFVARRVYHLV